MNINRKTQKKLDKILAKPFAKIEVTDERALKALAYPKVGIFHAGHIEAFVKSHDHVDANLLSTIWGILGDNRWQSAPYDDVLTSFDAEAKTIQVKAIENMDQAQMLMAQYKGLLKNGKANLPYKTVLLNIFTLQPKVKFHAIVESFQDHLYVRMYSTFQVTGAKDFEYDYVLRRLVDMTLRQDKDGGFTAMSTSWQSLLDRYDADKHPALSLGTILAGAIVSSSTREAA